MAKRAPRKRTPTKGALRRAGEEVVGAPLEETVFERRLEVARLVLRLLSGIEPVSLAEWRRRKNAARQAERAPKLAPTTGVRRQLAQSLRERRRARTAIRRCIEDQWTILGPLEASILENFGQVARLQQGGVEGYPTIRGFDPGPQQHQSRQSRWPATILRAPATCEVLCSTCIEPAILVLGRILRELRSLVADFDEHAHSRGEILTQNGQLRKLPRRILEVLADPVDTLEALAAFIPVSPGTVRDVAPAMKRLGLITGDAHRHWKRTPPGEQLLVEPS